MSDPRTSQTPWRRLPIELAAAMRPQLGATVAAVASAVTEATPVFANANAKFERDLTSAVQVALERFIDLVGTDEAAVPPALREVFIGLGAAEAREDHGPDVLLAAFRMASRMTLRSTLKALAQVREVDAEALIDLSDAISAFIDELAAASTDGFALQLREQAGEGDRRRRQLAELLLRGGAPEVVLASAHGIGWRTLGEMVPVVLPLEHARDARFRYGADGVVAERRTDAVLLLKEGPRASRSQLSEAFLGRGAVIGPTLHWSQMAEAVRLAELAAELVRAFPSPAPFFTDDYLCTLALRGEPGALAVVSSRRLKVFSTLRDAERERLERTLYSWLRLWGSRMDVSAELFVHPQTVSYRMKRLRELLGDELDDPTARYELLLVLTSSHQNRLAGLNGQPPPSVQRSIR